MAISDPDRVVFSDQPIAQLLIKVASRCNIDCSYCYWFRDAAVYSKPKLMSAEVLQQLLRRIEEHIPLYRFGGLDVAQVACPTGDAAAVAEFVQAVAAIVQDRHIGNDDIAAGSIGCTETHQKESLLRNARIGPIAERQLKPGEWRPLTLAEVRALESAVGPEHH